MMLRLGVITAVVGAGLVIGAAGVVADSCRVSLLDLSMGSLCPELLRASICPDYYYGSGSEGNITLPISDRIYACTDHLIDGLCWVNNNLTFKVFKNT